MTAALPTVIAGAGACDGDHGSAMTAALPTVIAGAGACDGDQLAK
jgi:hypothetical protein